MEQKINSIPSAETNDDSSTIADVTTASPNNAKPYVTCWLNFQSQLPKPLQEIYVLDRFGEIQATTHQGDWQKNYWVANDYLWTVRPACT